MHCFALQWVTWTTYASHRIALGILVRPRCIASVLSTTVAVIANKFSDLPTLAVMVLETASPFNGSSVHTIHKSDWQTRVATRTRLKMNQPDGGRFHISQIDCDFLQTYYRLVNKVTRIFEAIRKYQERVTLIFCPSAKYANTQSRRRSYSHWRRRNIHLACEQSLRENCSNPAVSYSRAGSSRPSRLYAHAPRMHCVSHSLIA